MLAYLGIKRTDGHQHLHLIGNDVRYRAAMDGTHCNYRRGKRVRLARDNRLDAEHGARRYYDWINGSLGEGPVTAAPEDGHFNRICRSAEKPCMKAHLARRKGRLVVNPNHNIWFRKP